MLRDTGSKLAAWQFKRTLPGGFLWKEIQEQLTTQGDGKREDPSSFGLESQTKHRCNRQCIKSHTGTVWPRPAGATDAAPSRLGLFLDKSNWNTDKRGNEVTRVETPEIHSGCRGAWRKCVWGRLKARPVKPELHCNQASGPQADRYLKSSGSFTRRAGEECVSVARGLEKLSTQKREWRLN